MRIYLATLSILAVGLAVAAGPVEPTRSATKRSIGFKENKGQIGTTAGAAAPFVLFKAEAPGLSAYITETGLTYVFSKTKLNGPERVPGRNDLDMTRLTSAKVELSWINVRLEGANIRKENIVKEAEGTERFNYFLQHCPQGIYDVHQYGKVTIREVYPGIDWVLYTNEQGMKYDFIVHPGADASLISLVYSSEEPIALQEDGSLRMKTPGGTLTEKAPVSYIKENSENVPCRFGRDVLDGHRVRIHFELVERGPEDATLVIDPQLFWATFTHTDDVDGPMSIRTNSLGQVFTAGFGLGGGSIGFPYPFDTLTFSGAFAESYGTGYINAFSNTGVLLWSTRYQGLDQSMQLAIDANDRVLLTGKCHADLVTAAGTGSFAGAYYNAVYGGGAYESDAFLLAFTPTGTREWATYLGGTQMTSIAVDNAGRIVVVGDPDDAFNLDQAPIGSFAGAYYQPTVDATSYFLGFAPNGALQWATSFPAMYFSQKAAEFTPAGKLVVSGSECFGPNAPLLATGGFAGATMNASAGDCDGYIAAFTNAGAQEWGTFFNLEGDQIGVTGVAVGPDGRIVVSANHQPTSFTGIAAGAFAGAYVDDVPGADPDFVFDPCLYGFNGGGVLQWATLLGGDRYEQITYSDNQQVAIDTCGNIYTSFTTSSANCQTVGSGCDSYYDGLNGDGVFTGIFFNDIMLMRFNPSGVLTWSTYYGGVNDDFRCPITTSEAGDLYLTGASQGGSFNTLDPGNGAWYMDDSTVLYDDSYILQFKPSTCEALTCYSYFTTVTNNGNACAGDCEATATALGVNGVAPYSYAWSNGQTTNTATGLCAGEYTVTTTDANGQTSTAAITVLQNSPIIITDSASVSSCLVDDGAAIFNYNYGTYGGTPDFSLGDFGYAVLWSTGSVNDTITGLAPGDYILTITDALGCTAVDTLTVGQITQPVASATALDYDLAAGESTSLFSTGGGTYTWSPSSGLSCTTCQSPTASPTDTTTYCVVVTDVNQCTDTACVVLNVVQPPPPCGDVFVPTAFSPNTSGHNDTQCVYGGCIASMTFAIYDRWGTKVFESTDQKQCWDGTNSGQALDPAVFVYRLEATLSTGESISKQGNITLIR